MTSRRLLLESKGTDAAKITEAEKLLPRDCCREDAVVLDAGRSVSALGQRWAVTGIAASLILPVVERTTYAQVGVRFTRKVFASYRRR